MTDKLKQYLTEKGFTEENTYLDFLYELIVREDSLGKIPMRFYKSQGIYSLTISYGKDGNETLYQQKTLDENKLMEIIELSTLPIKPNQSPTGDNK
jgi:hypothetical protein